MSDATPERDPDAEPISSAAGALESHAGELGADADSAGVWAPDAAISSLRRLGLAGQSVAQGAG